MSSTIHVGGISFCAAHRVEGHPKCSRLHGHNYRIEVDVEGEVQGDGMVIDFGILKSIIREIAEGLDHRYLASDANAEWDDPLISRSDALQLPVFQTTAECLSAWIATQISLSLGTIPIDQPLSLITVTLWETDTSFAQYQLRRTPDDSE